MEFYGKVIRVFEPQSGTSERGPWMMQEFVVEDKQDYPHKLVFTIMGEDRIKRYAPKLDQWVTVYFDVDSRSYTDKNGKERWSLSARAWDTRLDPANGQAPGEPEPITNNVYNEKGEKVGTAADKEQKDGLPF